MNGLNVMTGSPVNEGNIRKAQEEKWYAIYTNPRAEKLVNSRLVEENINTFLPLQKTFRKWSDRRKLVEKPLLPSYLFVKTTNKYFRLSFP